MTSREGPEHQRLLRLARTQANADPAVAECWELVLQGMEFGFVGVKQLEAIAAALETGSGRGEDEISFDAEGDQAVVTFVNTACRCPLIPFVAALRELHRRALLDPSTEHDTRVGARALPGKAWLQKLLRRLRR